MTCDGGKWSRGADLDYAWFRSNRIGPDHVRYHAPAQEDLGSFDAPADPQYGSLALPFRGPLKVGEGRKYRRTADDAGKLVYCQVSATDDGATVWKSAVARD